MGYYVCLLAERFTSQDPFPGLATFAKYPPILPTDDSFKGSAPVLYTRLMRRVCFTLKLRGEKIDEYVKRHRDVWPEMQDALRATGWKNYSLFLGQGGLLIGYVEVEDFEAAREGMKAFSVNARWQAEMADFFDQADVLADDAMKPLPQIFHLD